MEKKSILELELELKQLEQMLSNEQEMRTINANEQVKTMDNNKLQGLWNGMWAIEGRIKNYNEKIIKIQKEIESKKALENKTAVQRQKTEQEKWEKEGAINKRLRIAAEDGDLDDIKETLSEGALVDGKDAKGNTALALAAGAGKTDCVKFLLGKDAKPTFSIAEMAAEKGQVECLKLLIRWGALDSKAKVEEHYLLALANLKQGNLQQALHEVEACIIQKPNYLPILLLKGQIHFSLNDKPQAATAFRQVLKLEANNKQALNFLRNNIETDVESLLKKGLQMESTGDYEGAKTCYEQIIAFDPANQRGYHQLALLLRNHIKDCQQALVYSSKVIGLNPTAEHYLERANIYRALNQNNEALKDLESALKINSNTRGANLLRGKILIEQNKNCEAQAAFYFELFHSPKCTESTQLISKIKPHIQNLSQAQLTAAYNQGPIKLSKEQLVQAIDQTAAECDTYKLYNFILPQGVAIKEVFLRCEQIKHFRFIEILLNDEAIINKLTHDQCWILLRTAIKNEELNILNKLFKIDFLERFSSHYEFLMSEIISYIFEDSNGRKIIRLKALKCCLDNGIDPNYKHKNTSFAKQVVIYYTSLEALELLVNKGFEGFPELINDFLTRYHDLKFNLETNRKFIWLLLNSIKKEKFTWENYRYVFSSLRPDKDGVGTFTSIDRVKILKKLFELVDQPKLQDISYILMDLIRKKEIMFIELLLQRGMKLDDYYNDIAYAINSKSVHMIALLLAYGMNSNSAKEMAKSRLKEKKDILNAKDYQVIKSFAKEWSSWNKKNPGDWLGLLVKLGYTTAEEAKKYDFKAILATPIQAQISTKAISPQVANNLVNNNTTIVNNNTKITPAASNSITTISSQSNNNNIKLTSKIPVKNTTNTVSSNTTTVNQNPVSTQNNQAKLAHTAAPLAVSVMESSKQITNPTINSNSTGSTNSETKVINPNHLLINAVKSGDIENIKKLLANKSDLSAVDQNGDSALAWAVYKQNVEMVTLLLNAGANPNGRESENGTILNCARKKGNLTIVQLLVKAGAKDNTDNLISKKISDQAVAKPEFLVITHVKGGNIEALKKLLANKPNLTAVDHNGDSALAWAVYKQNIEMVTLLLNAGANPNGKESENGTILNCARKKGNQIIEQLLIKAGAKDTVANLIESKPINPVNADIAKAVTQNQARLSQTLFKPPLLSNQPIVKAVTDPSKNPTPPGSTMAPNTHFVQAVESYKKGNLQEAVKAFSFAILEQPQHAIAYLYRGNIYLELKEFDLAWADLRKAYELDSKLEGKHRTFARAYREQGNYPEALSEYEASLKQNAKDALAYCGRGKTYLQMGDTAAAREDAEQALAINPQMKEALDLQNEIQTMSNRLSFI